MSVPSDLSVSTIFRSLWDGLVEAFARLRLLSLAGFLIYLFAGILELLVPAENTVLREALDAGKTILILPVEIAIYRLLILGDASAGYFSAISAPRFPRLLGWSIFLWALFTLPPYLVGLITKSETADTIATLVTAVIVIVFLMRLPILFPALAVDAPGASLGNIIADTKGRIWLILKTYVIMLLPLLAVVAVVGLTSDYAGLPAWGETIRDSAFEFLATMVIAVAASRLFDWIGHQVKGLPAGSAQLAGQTPPAG